ncbi:DUF1501 domain-containing protein [Chitinophagaceae bacterium MMS25-I14]
MALSRRKFIQLSSLASASVMMPQFLKAFAGPQVVSSQNEKILVIVQLSGGNDGLNTVIPFRNDIYYKSRPVLGLADTEILKLNDEAGLHPSLKNMRALYDQGWLGILNNVGYPEPNRSHFRSMDIWQTGSASDELVTTGWLGRYLDNACVDCDVHKTMAIEVDDSLSLAMKGNKKSAIAIRDVNQFYKAASDPYFNRLVTEHQHEHEAKLADYLYQTLTETISSADYVYKQSKIYNTSQIYPDTQLGKRMKTIGSLINSHADTRVYYVSHGSFDTHVGQKDRQAKLFTELDDALAALVADLKQNNRMQDVMIMTFSEFGRRVAQNASGGTDHGTANNMFLISSGLKKQGLYNDLPRLTDLDEGDLRYEIDFKQVYATMLNNWLGTDARQIIKHSYPMLDFV